MTLRPLNDLALINKIASFHKGKKYLVGGCVRDWILGIKCGDLDFLFDRNHLFSASKAAQHLGGKLESFDKFLTARVLLKGKRLDFASFRKETYPKPAVLPSVSKAGTLKQDLKRRDFTINAMALSLNEEDKYKLEDPYGGCGDLIKRRLRILYLRSFTDDPTRIFRAARFCARFSLKLEQTTFKALKKAVKNRNISLLSQERKRNELLKILGEKKSFSALKLLKDWGALDEAWPFARIEKKIDSFKPGFERLVFFAACFPSPLDFISSLNLPGEDKKRALYELKPFDLRRNPVSPSPLQKKIYRALYKRNLKPLFIDFSYLYSAGFEPARCGEIMKKISFLQWSGKISGMAAARRLALREKK